MQPTCSALTDKGPTRAREGISRSAWAVDLQESHGRKRSCAHVRQHVFRCLLRPQIKTTELKMTHVRVRCGSRLGTHASKSSGRDPLGGLLWYPQALPQLIASCSFRTRFQRGSILIRCECFTMFLPA